MKLSTVLEGIKAVTSFGVGLLVAHECDKHDVPTIVTCTASCSTTAVAYELLSIVGDCIIEADEKRNYEKAYIYNDFNNIDELSENVTNTMEIRDIEKEETVVNENNITEDNKNTQVENEAASTEEVSENKDKDVKDEKVKQIHHQKNVNDDMMLAKQSLTTAEKKELEAEVMDKKQPTRPNRK